MDEIGQVITLSLLLTLWLLPIIAIWLDERLDPSSRALWVTLCLLVSWGAWVLYAILKPFRATPSGQPGSRSWPESVLKLTRAVQGAHRDKWVWVSAAGLAALVSALLLLGVSHAKFLVLILATVVFWAASVFLLGDGIAEYSFGERDNGSVVSFSSFVILTTLVAALTAVSLLAFVIKVVP